MDVARDRHRRGRAAQVALDVTIFTVLGLAVLVAAFTISLCSEVICRWRGVETTKLHYDHTDRYDKDTLPISRAAWLGARMTRDAEDAVRDGRRDAAGMKLVIMGLCRDIEPTVGRFARFAERVGGAFGDYAVVLFENDSGDATRAMLQEWSARNPRVTLLDCCDMGSCGCKLKRANNYTFGISGLTRIERMAEMRNRCLAFARERHGDADVALVVDTDIGGAICDDGIFHALGARADTPDGDWDVVACNGKMPVIGSWGTWTATYDALAHVRTTEDLAAVDLDGDGHKGGISNTSLMRTFFADNAQQTVTRWTAPDARAGMLHRVGNAFNGMALYKFPAMCKARYFATQCEHIGLAADMQRKLGRPLRAFVDLLWVVYAGFQGPPLV